MVSRLPWGTHSCQFYHNQNDLLDLLAPYFKGGLLNHEYCVWVTSERSHIKDALARMKRELPRFDTYLDNGQMEILPASDWYVKDGVFDAQRVLTGWIDKCNQASASGYRGMRLTSDTLWLKKSSWKSYADYEEELDKAMGKHRMTAICTYSLEMCRAFEVIHVVKNHGFALIKRGEWERIENAQRRRAEEKAQEKALAELQKIVKLRTTELKQVTESKLQEELRRHILERASRLKSEFLANMSHELRTPLNAIIGFSQMMHDEKLGPVSSDHKEYLGDILTSANYLLDLINDVLDLAKVEAGKMEFHPESVNLQHLVEETCTIARAMAVKKQLEMDISIDPDINSVVLDPAKFKQVLYNYLSNAIKFTPEGGRIAVRAVAEGVGDFRVDVKDTGIGIKPEDMEKLFVEFQQVGPPLSIQHHGTGLGLALTKKLVEAQEGKVGVNSILGKGSTFFAVLPRQSVAGKSLT